MKHQLPDGYVVKYHHIREMPEESGVVTPLPKGGMTKATIFDEHGVQVCSATARCRPDEAYNAQLGRDISFGRAVTKFNGEAARREIKRRFPPGEETQGAYDPVEDLRSAARLVVIYRNSPSKEGFHSAIDALAAALINYEESLG